MPNSRHMRAVVEFNGCYLGEVMSLAGLAGGPSGVKLRVRILRVHEHEGKLHIWALVRGSKQTLREMQRRLAGIKGAAYTVMHSSPHSLLIYATLPAVNCPRRRICPIASPSGRAFVQTAAIEDGRVVAVVLASSKRALQELEEHGFRVLHAEEDGGFLDLTPQQERILLTAYELGYYSYPRRISLKDLARVLGLSVSTVAERLRKAEMKVMTRIIKDELILLKYVQTPGWDEDAEAEEAEAPGQREG